MEKSPAKQNKQRAKRTNKKPIAVSEGAKFVFKAIDGKEYSLTTQQKMFCEKYLEFNGNGSAAYIEVYNPKNRNVARSAASEYLTKPNIVNYINSLLDTEGFNEQNVTKQHLFLLNQHGELSTKGRAVDMFYKLRGSYAPEQIKHSLDEESIDAEIERVKSEIAALGTSEKENNPE